MKSLFLPQAMEKALSFSVELADDLPPTLFTDRQRPSRSSRTCWPTLQVHREGLGHSARRAARWRHAGLRGARHRHRHRAGAAGGDLRGVPPGRWHHQPTLWRHGPGPVDLPRAGEPAGRPDRSAECAGRRQYLYPGVAAELQRAARRRADHRAAAEPCTGHHGRSDHAAAGARRDEPELPNRGAVSYDRLPDDRDKYPFKERCVLVIEDEPQFARILRDPAHELEYSCLLSQNADDGFDTAVQYKPDAILLDMRLPDHSGLTVLERLKRKLGDPPYSGARGLGGGSQGSRAADGRGGLRDETHHPRGTEGRVRSPGSRWRRRSSASCWWRTTPCSARACRG